MFDPKVMSKVHKARVAACVFDERRAKYYGEMAASLGANDFLPGMSITPFSGENAIINEELEKPTIIVSVNKTKTNTYEIKGYATEKEIFNDFGGKLKEKLKELGTVEVEADSNGAAITAVFPVGSLTIGYINYIGMFTGKMVLVGNKSKIKEILQDIFGVFNVPVEIITLVME